MEGLEICICPAIFTLDRPKASRQAIKFYRAFLQNVDVLMDFIAGLQTLLRMAETGSLE
jgi:hypothetical protein